MKRFFRLAAIATAVLTMAFASRAQCPDYTHKDDVLLGQAQQLPEGFFVFTRGESVSGLHHSAIHPYAPQVIPGTESDYPYSTDVSSDGRWAVYVAMGDTLTSKGERTKMPEGVYLVNLATNEKFAVPTHTVQAQLELDNPALFITLHPSHVGFYHGSPKGTELFYYFSYYGPYWHGDWQIRAIGLDLSGDTPVFGSTRTIMDIDTTHNLRLWAWGGALVTDVAHDAVFGSFYGWGAGFWEYERLRNYFVTIPQDGHGTAAYENIYQFSDPTDENLFGCAQTISHDGSLCLGNAAKYGDPECVSNNVLTTGENQHHKGFYITPFFRQGVTPPMKIDDQINTNGVSINWSPPEYRIGSTREIDFSEWSFGNNGDYVIGALNGTLTPVTGLWVVHWKTNTWTLVTSNKRDGTFRDPCVHMTGGNATHERPGRAPVRGSSRGRRLQLHTGRISVGNASVVRLYSLRGEILREIRGIGQSGEVHVREAPCILECQ